MRALWIWLGAAVFGVAAVVVWLRPAQSDSYVAIVAEGNRLFEGGKVADAAARYERAAKLAPESADVRLNLAIAYLRLGRNDDALDAARRTLELDRNDPAAYYIMGCARMHRFDWQEAIRAFQQARAIQPRVAAVSYQLGLAHEQSGQIQDAVHDMEAAVLYDPGLAAAHFRLSRLYLKLGRPSDAQAELRQVRTLLAKASPPPDGAAQEACIYTQPRAPFVLDQPNVPGIAIRFVDATAEAFGGSASAYRGPVAVLDYAHDGRNSLFVREAGGNFRLLDNRAGAFRPLGGPIAAPAAAEYRQALVGDLDDDGLEDVLVLGENGSRVYRFRPGGKAVDYTRTSGLSRLRASAGLLADLDFTGNLDLVAVRPNGAGLQAFRNLGEFSFTDVTEEIGLPPHLAGAVGVDAEDWDNDGLPTLFVARPGAAPAAFSEHRGSGFAARALPEGWPAGRAFAGGDLNNDLETDAVIAGDGEIDVILSGVKEPVRLPLGGFQATGVLLTDFDNDGWLDLIAYGPGGLRAWRNEGHGGFREVTGALGLSAVGPVGGLLAADLFGHGAEDLLAVTPSGLKCLRNEGGSVNHLLRLRLTGTRSNASALGARIVLEAGRWRTSRTVHALPIEIGTGVHAKLDSVTIHWTDVTTTAPGVAAGPSPAVVVEPKLPTGSCPYLYAWDGAHFRFVTDVLGAAPLGLPVSLSRLVPSNPRELIALGDERQFAARGAGYELRLTDELREILYLDQARLVVVDHPQGTRVFSTSKLVPGPKFGAPEVWTLRPLGAPRRAVRSDGADVTGELAAVDGCMAGPVALRRPQMRGYALPYSVTLDFGPIDVHRPLVLALTGWLQFGGGMANIAASLDPEAGPPFPRLEAELPDGSWQPVPTEVGAPCGKTKTILVDLQGALPAGARRLRLSTAFEIYWDAALLCERVPARGAVRTLRPARADLRWRGFSRYRPGAPGLPLTPDYGQVAGTPPWDFTPAGWCTRYGDARALIDSEDNRLAVLNGGDELALSFPAAELPPPAPGAVRDFFLYLSGWDKDADFHVRRGDEVGPLPYHGMDDQNYGLPAAAGTPAPPPGPCDSRWVGPAILTREPEVHD